MELVQHVPWAVRAAVVAPGTKTLVCVARTGAVVGDDDPAAAPTRLPSAHPATARRTGSTSSRPAMGARRRRVRLVTRRLRAVGERCWTVLCSMDAQQRRDGCVPRRIVINPKHWRPPPGVPRAEDKPPADLVPAACARAPPAEAA